MDVRVGVLGVFLFAGSISAAESIAFLLSGDPQYLAEKSEKPEELDPLSEQANSRFIERVNQLPGTPIPDKLGGGTVSTELKGLLVVGDLIDSLDKRGDIYEAMQRFEWERYKADYGLKGGDGRLDLPVYELHGNHDGPNGDNFLIDDLIARNRERPQVMSTSTNGLHYAWNWGPVHFINLGLYAGRGDGPRRDRD